MEKLSQNPQEGTRRRSPCNTDAKASMITTMETMRAWAQTVLALCTSRRGVWVFFGVTLILGLVVSRDYGISWDEKAMHVLGEEAFNYIFHGTPYPTHVGIRFHGAWFEVLQYALESLLHLRYARHVYMLRHAMDFVFFWAGLVGMYVIGMQTFKQRGWALFCAVMLLLSPRIFGHSFVNARDVPAMVCFIWKMAALLYFLHEPSFRRAILFGIASGFVMSLRVGGLFIPLYVLIFLGLHILEEHLQGWHTDGKRYAGLLAVYGVTFACSTIALWPLLWSHPLQNFMEAMNNMMTAQQAAGGFYFGKIVSEPLPWHWIPVQAAISTPPLYTVLFLGQVAALAVAACTKPRSLLLKNRDALLFFLWFIIPILIVIVLKGHLFDEWRHVYFIYPALLLLAAHGLRNLWNWIGALHDERRKVILQTGAVLIVLSTFLETGIWVVRNHPLEYRYYSIPSRWVEGYFPLDYWGLSYRQGFKWLLNYDKSELITVQVTGSAGWENLNILTQDQRRRLVVKNSSYPTKYILDNYQWKDYRHTFPEKDKIHAIEVEGMDVLGIYRNPQWTPETDAGTQRMEDYKVQERFSPGDMP